MIDIALALSIFWNSLKVRLINMALIAEVCRKRAWLLSGDYSSNIQIVTFNLSNSLKTNIFGALPRTPLWERAPLPSLDPQLRYLPFFSSFRLESLG